MIPSLAVHQLQDSILDYLRTTFGLSDPKIEAALFEFLRGPDGLFRPPFLDIRLPFRVAGDGEHPLGIDLPFPPYRHQLLAFDRLSSADGRTPQPTLVTTGTGSGKTECFLYPILDHCLRHQDRPGIKAILLYPMNALASDQAKRLAQTLFQEGFRGKVTAGLYVGGKGRHGALDAEHLIDDRAILRKSPPDILLTNYRMLDFLLLRPEDRDLWQHNDPETLRYLVLDELHTYDGAQGSDVACLIRRLKNRLSIPEGVLCPVGTSATTGDGGEGAPELLGFATQIFGQEFAADSLVREDRQGAAEALGAEVGDECMPGDGDVDALHPDNASGIEAWIEKQIPLWFVEPFAAEPLLLGERLKSHPFLRQLLRAQGRRVRSLEAIQSWLREHEDGWADLPEEVQQLALASFVGLVSFARSKTVLPDGSVRAVPFLQVQVQLWMRELRQLLLAVEAEPRFAWASANPNGGVHWLPMACCRSCGLLGWASVVREGETHLQHEVGAIGKAWYERARGCHFVALGHGVDLEGTFPPYLHRLGLELGFDKPGDMSLPVRFSDQCSEGRQPRFLQRCPDCDSDLADGLSMLGARAASLLSVGVSHLFQSTYNDDKKMLAFTDSVQDASHRAGFFGARTYRFNLRTTVQGVLEDGEGVVPLIGLEAQMRAWLQQARGMSEGHALATLLPSDLWDLPEYQEYLDTGGRVDPEDLIALLDERVAWEVAREYGHNALIGRTLEKSGCSTVKLDGAALDKVAEILMLELQEGSLIDAKVEVGPARCRHFVAGLLNRLRVRGGVLHPMLAAYARSGGTRYLLSRRHQPLISPFGPQSRLPRFVTDRADRERVFESVRSEANRWTWHRDWAARCLGLDRTERGIPAIYGEALRRSTDAGLLAGFDLDRGGGRGWGLRREALQVTRHVGLVRCAACRSSYTLPVEEEVHWRGQPCPYYRCSGTLEAGAVVRSYYGERYRSGNVERIFAREHTGLLRREDREDLEEDFKADEETRRPGAANLLVCTPTLEMGIDIGDLSAMVLCSVPPDTAKYLQRVGRAGRKTGNALCLQMAISRPHDQYFFASPEAMLAGHVHPPGCFLDAPEMLKRQLLACAMDGWARSETELRQIPGRTTLVLSESGRAEFPGRFLAWYKEHHATVLEEFLNQFGGQIKPTNQERLRQYTGPLNVEKAVQGAFDAVEDERQDLRNTLEKIRRSIERLEGGGADTDETRAELVDLKMSQKILRGMMRDLGQKYPLNVLTDAGLLPNYAFPEPGVTLRSSLGTEARDEGGRTVYESREYMRAASTAIREFAPFNTFYAEGHRVQIQEIDLRPPSEPVPWRVCANCAHMEHAVAGREVAADCPRCGDGQWSDAGQVRELVNFRRVRTLTNRLQAASTDHEDEREQRFYQVETLIDVGEEHYNGARVIEDLPFGIELLTDLSLREVNLGEVSGRSQASGQTIAGRPLRTTGFEVCTICGKVKEPGRQIEHARWCRVHRNPDQEKNSRIELYREVTSEAIRLLLPVAEFEWAEQVHTLRAALALGFRRRFKGKPQHLKIEVQDEPVESGGRRRFLVVFDTVPGGTGYLSELAHVGPGADHMRDVLELARVALEQCACQQKATPEAGCYQCLYAYEEQRHLGLLSNQRAREVLGRILGRWGDMTPCKTLSEVSLASRMESELEELFLAVLAEHAESSAHMAWSEGIRGGREFWTLEIGGEKWEVVPQEALGARQGVRVGCRPDFVFRNASGDPGIMPVAVFCDGFAFHALPGQESGRIGDDFHKRHAIRESGQWCTWSVTWKDVVEFREGARGMAAPLAHLSGPKLNRVFRQFDVDGISGDVVARGAMQMLLAYLAHPRTTTWRDAAGAVALVWASEGATYSSASIAAWQDALSHEAGCPDASVLEQVEAGRELNGVMDGPYLRAVVSCPVDAVASGSLAGLRTTIRLLDRQDERDAPDFEPAWRRFLQLHNLLQFYETTVAVTTEQILAESGSEVALPAVREAAEDVEDESLALLLPEERDVVLALRKLGAPDPDLDYLPGFEAEASLYWPDSRLALLSSDQERDRGLFEMHGWTVLPIDADPATIAAAMGPEAQKDG